MNVQAQKQMKNALTGLILEGQEFFASLALRMPLVQDKSIETAATNGQMIKYNPDYVLTLSRDAQKALLCHEVMHVACGHIWRIDLRDPAKANIAMDYAINPLIAATKNMTMPPGYLDNPAYHGMSFEQIYRLLPDRPGGGGNDQPGGGGNDQPGGGGQDVQPAPGESKPDPQGNGMTEQDWKQAIMQAAKQAQAHGVMPAGFERLLNQIKYPACRDLVAALLEFCSRTARDDYSFRRPNKRHVARGLVLPELYSVTCPPIVACVDTSGSVYDELLEDYRGALQRVLDEC